MLALSTLGTEGALPLAAVGALLVALVWAVSAAMGRTGRPALWAALVVSLAVIGWITIGLTLARPHSGTAGLNLTLFQEINRALDTGATRPWVNLVGNVVMFVPFGALVASLVRRGFVARVVAATGLAVALSAAIEASQYMLGRVADVDDVVLNTAGAFLGAVVAAGVASARAGARRRRNYDGRRASSSVGRAADF